MRVHPTQDGVVAEQGSHQQLMLASGIYSTMWSRQKQDVDVEPGAEAGGSAQPV